MEILNKNRFDKCSAVVIGKFDGVHKGHQKLFSIAREIAQKEELVPIAYTFCSLNNNCFIITDEQKMQLLEENGIEAVYCQQFTQQFRNTSPQEFVQMLKNNFSAKHVIIGFNFRFGKDRSASADDMASLCEMEGIKVTIASPVIFRGKPISSTRIRSEIETGNMENVFAMMGRRFTVTADVIKGKQLGRKLGFPTANLNTKNISIFPKNGVYATRVHINHKSYPAVTNIGINPTVDTDSNVKFENHIVGFSADLYGEYITVEFLQFLRDEEQFGNIAHLTSQLQYDTENAVKIFKNLLTD